MIFVGVVLAFQFENWREDRRDREREAEALEALAADFRANVVNLDVTLVQQRRSAGALAMWLETATDGEADVDRAVLASEWPFAISWYAEEMVSGAWDGLTSSGDAGLLRDPELRAMIAEFYGIVDSGFEDHDNEMDVLFELQRLTAPQTARVTHGDGRILSPEEVRSAGLVGVVDEILATPTVDGLLTWKWVTNRNRLVRMDELRTSAESILARIDSLRSGAD